MMIKTPKSVSAIIADVQNNADLAQAEIDASLAAIEEGDDKLHAFTQWAENPRAGNGPLAGIAVGLKDILDCYDMKSRYGSAIYGDFQPIAILALQLNYAALAQQSLAKQSQLNLHFSTRAQRVTPIILTIRQVAHPPVLPLPLPPV